VTALSRKPYYPPARATPELVRMLANVTEELVRACCVGDPAPRVREMWEQLQNPQPGDIVLETSSRRRDPEWPAQALGLLLFVTGVKVRTEEQWAEAERAGWWRIDRRRANAEGYWYVDPLDGSQRAVWENCSFVRVPWPPPSATGGPVTLTRETIVAGLADAGFAPRR
jgi:hypothetical protein